MKRSLNAFLVLFVGLVWGCGGDASPEDTPPSDTAEAEVEAVVEDTVPLSPPAPETGRLTTVSRGYQPLTGSWAAEAGICRDTPVFLLEARGENTGVIVLLGLPDDGRLVSYPVVWEPGPPEAVTSRVAAQVVPQAGALSYQASDGWVEVEQLGSETNGTFSVQLRQAEGSDVIELAGTFSEVPVEELSGPECDFIPIDGAG